MQCWSERCASYCNEGPGGVATCQALRERKSGSQLFRNVGVAKQENVVYRHHCTVILQANRKGIISDVLYEERRGRLPHQYQC